MPNSTENFSKQSQINTRTRPDQGHFTKSLSLLHLHLHRSPSTPRMDAIYKRINGDYGKAGDNGIKVKHTPNIILAYNIY